MRFYIEAERDANFTVTQLKEELSSVGIDLRSISDASKYIVVDANELKELQELKELL